MIETPQDDDRDAHSGGSRDKAMDVLRLICAPIASILVAVFLLEHLPRQISIGTLSFSGIAPIFIVAGIGGLVVSLIAPRYKLTMAFGTGALFPALAYFLMASTNKYAHYDALEVSWTLGLPIAYLLGGLIGYRLLAEESPTDSG